MARKTNKVFSTSPEEIEKINPENRELMHDFLNYLETTDHSPTSISAYKNNLEIFFVYLLNYAKNKDFIDIKKRDILNWQTMMVKNNLSPARIRTLRSTISSLSNFCTDVLDEEEKWETFRNIVNKIPAPQLNPTREKTILEDEQCQWLLDLLIKQKKYQQACAFALAWASGRRKSELLRMKVSYITEENLKYGSLYKTPEKVKSKGRGSKGKPIYFYILKSKFKPYFDLWIEERKRLGVPEDMDALFVKFDKKNNVWMPAKKTLLESWANKFSKLLGVDFYFHCLRHQFTTSLVKCNIPASVIKDIVCWESTDMVDRYTDIDVDDKLGEYFSEEGIKTVEKKSLSEL